MSEGNVVHHDFRPKPVETPTPPVERYMKCKNCLSKLWVLTHDDDSEFPRMRCHECGTDCGRIGWLDAK